MVTKDLNDNFEKRNLSDSSEILDSFDEKIEDGLYDLENKSNNLITNEEYITDKQLIQSESLSKMYELQHEISNKIKNSTDVMRNKADDLQEERRVITSNQKNIISFPQTIQQNIEESSEQKESSIGRQKSYTQVQSFVQSVSQEPGFFGKIVKILS